MSNDRELLNLSELTELVTSKQKLSQSFDYTFPNPIQDMIMLSQLLFD